MLTPRLHAPAVATVAALVLLTNLGGPALWDEDEPKNAACTQAMLDRGDWVVPTFNGRLRIEKPALVNWVQMAGFTLAGRNETGARLGSALLSIGTCLLTWRIGVDLFNPQAGLLGGLAMASCLWTALGGRTATPDAPLLFLTTLALWCFARTVTRNWAGGGPRPLSRGQAWGVGAACGLAILAKGPVGLCLPLASLAAFAGWQAAIGLPESAAANRWAAVRQAYVTWLQQARSGLHPLSILAAAALVAAPWYAWVTLRTGGAWLHGFIMVHNVHRFAEPMEGHGGSSLLYYPAVIAVGFFPWSIVLAAVFAHAAGVLRSPRSDARQPGLRLVLCWFFTWVIAFSCAGTKLPGYVWPAYPALAVLTGLFLSDWARGDISCVRWCRHPEQALELVMRTAWLILGVVGVGFTIGIPLAARAVAPELVRLGWLGLVPLAAAGYAWHCQTRQRRPRALTALALTACVWVAALAAWGGSLVGGGARGPKELVTSLADRPAADAWAGFGTVPPSVVFYAGTTIQQLDSTAEITSHLTQHPDTHLVVDSRYVVNLPQPFPPGFAVIDRVKLLFAHDVLLIGPSRPPAPENPLACLAPPSPQ